MRTERFGGSAADAGSSVAKTLKFLHTVSSRIQMRERDHYLNRG